MINLHFVHSNLSNSAEDGFEKKTVFEDNLNLALNASAFDRLLLQNFQFSSEIFDILDRDNGANFHFHFLFRIQ